MINFPFYNVKKKNEKLISYTSMKYSVSTNE